MNLRSLKNIKYTSLLGILFILGIGFPTTYFATKALSPTVSATETIFVTSNQKAGRYNGPIYVKLTASNPDAKIWYTCRRNGTPSDLLKYESPILLEKSCAMIYFAYVTTELESKIERTDYTILYSNDVQLDTEDQTLFLKNTGENTVDIGGWEVIAGTGSISIQPGTTLLPGAKYSLGKVNPASYELKSPEGYTKDQVAVAPTPKPIPQKVATVPKKITVPKIENTQKIDPVLPTTVQPVLPKIEDSSIHQDEITPVVSTPTISKGESSPSINPLPETTIQSSDIKASASEATIPNNQVSIALALITMIAAAMFFRKSPKK